MRIWYGRHIVQEFVSRCIAPLQERSHPSWEFSGLSDRTRLFVGPDSETEARMVKITMNWLLGGKVDPVPLPSSVVPLHQDKENIDAILASLPSCDEHGVRRVWRSPAEYETHRKQRQEISRPTPRSPTFLPADGRPTRWRLVPLLAADRLPGPS